MTKEALTELIQACKQNDSLSQKALYKHFYNYGMTVCSRYAKDREEAKEIMNDSFVKVFSKLNQYNSSLSFKAWFNRILVNTAIDYFRKGQSKPRMVELVHAQHIETKAVAIDNLSVKEILSLVQNLSPAYRIIFNLYVVEGFKHTEIAEKLGISTGTSKSNLSKARLKLKAMILQMEGKRTKYG